MLRNYLAAALRNMVRNRLYAVINISGLAIGLVAALLIGLFVCDQLSYDRWIPGHERTYLITQIRTDVMNTPTQMEGMFFDLREPVTLALPAVEAIARLARGYEGFRRGEIEANADIWFADADIFRVLPLPVFAGDVKAALDRSDGLVLTRSLARKYFGRDTVIGEVIEVNRQFPMTVLAVIEDIPSNTHFLPPAIISARASFAPAYTDRPNMKSAWAYYVRLKSGYSDQEFRRDFDAFAAQLNDPEFVGPPGKPAQTVPIALADIHFSNLLLPGGLTSKGSMAVVAGAITIGLLTLLVAAINFVNLMTAWASRRATEVGVRKVSGAERRHLMGQFMGESALYVLIATLAAIAITGVLSPQLQAFLLRREAFPYLHEPAFLAGVAMFAGFLAILAGAYPAFVLSAFRPARVLRTGSAFGSGSVVLRRTLTTVQFAALIGLMLGAVTVHRQLHFAFNEGLRIPTDQVLWVAGSCRGAFKDRVAAIPGVREAVCSERRALTTGTFRGSPLILRDGATARVVKTSIGPGFFDFYGIRPIAGRLLPERSGDEMAYVADAAERGQPSIIAINEAGVRGFGFQSATEAIGQVLTIPFLGKNYPAEIVGVVPDFNLDSIGTAVPPTYFFADPAFYTALNIRVSGENIPETVAAIDRLWKEFGEPRPINRSFLNQWLQDIFGEVARQEQLFGAFTAVAVFIACLGLFGLSAFTAELRTKEIGVRKAMGARQVDILRLLVWEFAKPVLWANTIAWPVGYLLMRRWLEGFAHHIELTPWMFLAASAAALLIAVLTVIGHALTVARAEPVTALRYE